MSDQDPKCKQSELTINSSQGDLLEIQEVFFPLFLQAFSSPPLFTFTSLASHLSIPQGLTSAQFALTFFRL